LSSLLVYFGTVKKIHHRGTENTEKTRRKKILCFPLFFSSAILCVLCVPVVVFILQRLNQ
jgi:hypothetical protein